MSVEPASTPTDTPYHVLTRLRGAIFRVQKEVEDAFGAALVEMDQFPRGQVCYIQAELVEMNGDAVNGLRAVRERIGKGEERLLHEDVEAAEGRLGHG